jgi:hypothetical protein
MPAVDRVFSSLQVGVGRDQQPNRLRIFVLNLLEKLDSGHPRHPLVGQHHADLVLLHQLKPRGRTRRGQHGKVIAAHRLKDDEIRLLVINE